MGNSVHEIAVTTGSLGAVEKVTEEISSLAGDRELSVSPWQVFAAEFYNGMQADEASLRIVLGIIIGMAALGVLNTILMMVLERRREFGVMKAIGTRPGSIVKMLVIEANIMGFSALSWEASSPPPVFCSSPAMDGFWTPPGFRRFHLQGNACDNNAGVLLDPRCDRDHDRLGGEPAAGAQGGQNRPCPIPEDELACLLN